MAQQSQERVIHMESLSWEQPETSCIINQQVKHRTSLVWSSSGHLQNIVPESLRDWCIFQVEITKKTIGKSDLSKGNFDCVLQLWLGAGVFFNSAPLIERSGSSDLSLLETQHWIVIFYFWDKLLYKEGKSAPSTQEYLSDSSSTT